MSSRKQQRKERRQKERQGKTRATSSGSELLPEVRPLKAEPFQPKNEAQRRYAAMIKANTVTFGIGPAGTGKSYVVGALAANALENREIERIIVTRPAVEAGESLGFLPGELEEKFEPYFGPFRDILNERLGKSYVEYLIKAGRIEAQPLAYMRGRTFKNAWVILDEAQNTSPTQMKLFLTRIGEGAKIIVNGDIAQKDVTGESGLSYAIDILEGVKSISTMRFKVADIVRSGIVQDIVERFEEDTVGMGSLRKALGGRA